MKYESSFKSEADGLEISVMALIPDKKPYRAVVQLVHGMSAVSYTHLDVYKRQVYIRVYGSSGTGDLISMRCVDVGNGLSFFEKR